MHLRRTSSADIQKAASMLLSRDMSVTNLGAGAGPLNAFRAPLLTPQSIASAHVNRSSHLRSNGSITQRDVSSDSWRPIRQFQVGNQATLPRDQNHVCFRICFYPNVTFLIGVPTR